MTSDPIQCIIFKLIASLVIRSSEKYKLAEIIAWSILVSFVDVIWFLPLFLRFFDCFLLLYWTLFWTRFCLLFGLLFGTLFGKFFWTCFVWDKFIYDFMDFFHQLFANTFVQNNSMKLYRNKRNDKYISKEIIRWINKRSLKVSILFHLQTLKP